MTKYLALPTLLACCLWLPVNARAQERSNAVNACPIAPVFGVFSINYEHLFGRRHGLAVRFDYEAIPKTYSDASIESSGNGLILNYRWHVSESMASVFMGVYTRYRRFSGAGTSRSIPFDFTMPELTLGVNMGKRWVLKNGFNVAFGLGYGVSSVSEDADPDNADIASALAAFRDGYSFFNPGYGELSVGYSF